MDLLGMIEESSQLKKAYVDSSAVEVEANAISLKEGFEIRVSKYESELEVLRRELDSAKSEIRNLNKICSDNENSQKIFIPLIRYKFYDFFKDNYEFNKKIVEINKELEKRPESDYLNEIKSRIISDGANISTIRELILQDRIPSSLLFEMLYEGSSLSWLLDDQTMFDYFKSHENTDVQSLLVDRFISCCWLGQGLYEHDRDYIVSVFESMKASEFLEPRMSIIVSNILKRLSTHHRDDEWRLKFAYEEGTIFDPVLEYRSEIEALKLECGLNADCKNEIK